MRFNSEEHLTAWRTAGKYPAIHEAIFSAVATHVCGGSVLDLCCSTGLLGERMRRQLGLRVVGVEADVKAVTAGLAAGVELPVTVMRVEPATLGEFIRVIRANSVTAIVARRCLPELFGWGLDGLAWGRRWAEAIAAASVTELVIQGRVPTANARNLLPTVQHEIKLLQPTYRAVVTAGQVAYLRRV